MASVEHMRRLRMLQQRLIRLPGHSILPHFKLREQERERASGTKGGKDGAKSKKKKLEDRHRQNLISRCW